MEHVVKIVNQPTKEVVAEVICNHSISLDDAVCIVGEFIFQENPWDENVLIGDTCYWFDDLCLIWDGENV